MPAANIIEAAIVCFSHHRIHRTYIRVFGNHIINNCIGHQKSVQRICERNGRLNSSQFFNLGKSQRFAVSIGHMHGTHNFIFKHITAMGFNYSNTGPNTITLDNSFMSDSNTLNIGNGIPFPGSKQADFETHIPRTGFLPH